MGKVGALNNLGVLGNVGHFLNYATSLGGRAPEKITRFLRFSTSSTFSLIIDIILLAFFVEIFGIASYVAAGFSFAISGSINYFINRKWGFKGTITGLLKGYFLFSLFSVIGIAMTVYLMWLFVNILGFYYIIARIIVAIIEGTLSFVANSSYTFKMPDVLHIGQHHLDNNLD